MSRQTRPNVFSGDGPFDTRPGGRMNRLFFSARGTESSRDELKEHPYAHHSFETRGVLGIAVDEGSGWHGLTQRDSGFQARCPR